MHQLYDTTFKNQFLTNMQEKSICDVKTGGMKVIKKVAK